MNLPQFTAEESLLPTIGHYRTNTRAVGRFARGVDNIILPTVMYTQDGEVINVHGCAPGDVLIESGDSWDCIPRSLLDFLLNPDGGVNPPPPVPPGPPGGGGGGWYPVDGGGTREMDKACRDAATGCFPLSTTTTTCARLRCRKNYCNDHECTADEKQLGNKSKSEYDGAQCDLYPCNKETKRK
jgi:hypothetical protein